MNKAKLMLVLNPVLFVSLCLQVITSLFLFFNLFPSRSETWSEVHEYNGLAFIVLAILHLFLNWSWVKANFFKKNLPR